VYLKRIVVLTAVMAVAFSVHASSTPLHVAGLGMTPCWEVAKVGGTDSGQGTKRIELEAWAQGFLDGLMVASAWRYIEEITEVEGTPISIVYNSDGFWDRFVDHCQENESDNFGEAVMALWEEEEEDGGL